MKIFKSAVLCLLVLILLPRLGLATDPDSDLFYSKGVSLDEVRPSMESMKASILSPVIWRSFRPIWYAADRRCRSQNYALLRQRHLEPLERFPRCRGAQLEKPLGIGWSMHMGTLRGDRHRANATIYRHPVILLQ